jgi:ferredoxin--NADP+ reductase
MFPIIEKKNLSPQVTSMKFSAPYAAKNARPGQFVVIRIDERGERIPLTIAESDKKEGTITVIFQEAGATTKRLANINKGGAVIDIIGPLGRPTHVEKAGRVICVGGGVGAAEIYPVAGAFKAAGNEVISIIGARNKELLFLADEMRAISSRLYITTDDGSFGRKGFVTDVLKELLDAGGDYGLVYAVGPVLMMRAAALLTKNYNVKTLVSLNANMVDATGMCGTCRVTVAGKTKFACVDGPDFDAHQIDFEEFINRDKRFKDKEEESLRYHEKAGCARKG